MTEKQEKAKNYLMEIATIKCELVKLTRDLETVTSSKNKLPIKHNKRIDTLDATDKLILMYENKEKKITKEMIRLETLLDSHIATIEKIPYKTTYDVIYLHYVEMRPWVAICKEMHYAKSTISEYHTKGLKTIYDFIK